MKLTIAELYQILLNFVGTTIVRIHAVTPQKDHFSAGIAGSRKKADSMLTNIGVDFKSIMKEQWTSFLLTSCKYPELIKNIITGSISKELAEIGIEVTKADKEAMKNLLTEWEESERKNGTTINGYLAESSKDNMGMITVYRNVKDNSKFRFLNGDEVIDKNDTNSRFAPYFKIPKAKDSKKQAEYFKENGIKLSKYLITQNFRLDRIKHIKLNGIDYEIVSE